MPPPALDSQLTRLAVLDPIWCEDENDIRTLLDQRLLALYKGRRSNRSPRRRDELDIGCNQFGRLRNVPGRKQGVEPFALDGNRACSLPRR